MADAEKQKLTDRMRVRTRDIHDTADNLTNIKVALAVTDRFMSFLVARYTCLLMLFAQVTLRKSSGLVLLHL